MGVKAKPQRPTPGYGMGTKTLTLDPMRWPARPRVGGRSFRGAIVWLKNRKLVEWRDVQQLEHVLGTKETLSHARGAGLNSSMVFAKLEEELVRRIVDRPRFEAFKKRLTKQQARVRRRDACFHVFNNQLTNPQRSDLEDG
jgi:hypothetical protein